MAGDQGAANGSPFERSDLLERVLHAFGWTAIVAVVAAIPFVILTTGSFAIGQPMELRLGVSREFPTLTVMVVTVSMGLVPGVYAAGVAQQALGWPLPVRLGIVASVAAIGAAFGASVVGLVVPMIDTVILGVLSGAGAAVYLSSPGLTLLFSSDRRSYGKIVLGVFGVLVTLILFILILRVGGLWLWPLSAAAIIATHGTFLAAAWIGEGLGYDVADPEPLRRRTERLRERIGTVYADGSVAAEDRDRWRKDLDDLEAGFDTAVAEERVIRRLGRHGRILFTVGVAFTVLAGLIWFLGLAISPGAGHPNPVWDRRLALGWLGSLAIGYAVSLPLLGIVAGSSASLRERDRSDLLETADERVDEIREEVLETVRARKVEEDE